MNPLVRVGQRRCPGDHRVDRVVPRPGVSCQCVADVYRPQNTGGDRVRGSVVDGDDDDVHGDAGSATVPVAHLDHERVRTVPVGGGGVGDGLGSTDPTCGSGTVEYLSEDTPCESVAVGIGRIAVSYTHLTLPTIYSV